MRKRKQTFDSKLQAVAAVLDDEISRSSDAIKAPLVRLKKEIENYYGGLVTEQMLDPTERFTGDPEEETA